MVNVHTKICYYYTHYECLGHTTRILSLLKNLKKHIYTSNHFLIQASKPQDFLRLPEYIQTFNLPYYLFSRKDFRILPTNNKNAITLRANSLLSVIRKIMPNIFITEYFPLGRNFCKYELFPSLILLLKKRKLIFSSVGYPVIPSESIKDLEKIVKFYKKIFIHTPPLELDYVLKSFKEKEEKIRYLDIFNQYRNKIIFTGYILPCKLDFTEKEEDVVFNKDKINILVTRGAGAYYPKIISCSIEASELVDEDVYFIIVAGPSTSEKEWLYFLSLIGKKCKRNAILIKYTSGINELLKKCDVCVSTASYNTSIAIMFFKKNSIVIPFEGYGSIYYREQPSRARMLEDILGSTCLNYKDLNPIKLAYTIEKRIKTSSSVRAITKKDWFKGSDVFIKELSNYLIKQ